MKEEDVPLYWDAIVRITNSHPWPWTQKWGRVHGMTVPEKELNMPSADQIVHMMNQYLNPEAISAVKARVRLLRHRKKQAYTTLQIRPEVHGRLSEWASQQGFTLSDAIDSLLDLTSNHPEIRLKNL